MIINSFVLPTSGVTIDKEGTHFMEDAFSVMRIHDGWNIWVHIPNFIGVEKIKNAFITRESLKILKEKHHFALNRQTPSICLYLKITNEGKITQTSVLPSSFTNTKKITFGEINQLLKKEDPYWQNVLECAKALLLQRNKKTIDEIVFDSEDAFLIFQHGKIEKQTTIEFITKEIMIATNAALTDFLHQKNIPIIFRNCKITEVYSFTQKQLKEILIKHIPEKAHLLPNMIDCKKFEAIHETKATGHEDLGLLMYARFYASISRLRIAHQFSHSFLGA